MSKNDASKQKLYSVEEVKELINMITDHDALTIYTASDIRRIFSFASNDSAYRLMKHPAFPLMRIGKKMYVTKKNLIKFISDNSKGTVDLS
ncbi:hypothetical protein M2140_000026 [Clostridiales Family XIII bacterium PM5-7]